MFDCVISFNQKKSDRFEKEVLHRGSLVLIGPKDNPLYLPQSISLKDLDNLPMIRIKNLKTNTSQNNLDEQIEKAGINIEWNMQTETIQVAKAMVSQGLGYAIIDDYSASIFFQSERQHKLLPKMTYEFGMMINREKPISHHATNFISFVKTKKV
jgi:DNA-binding transcriptional LysR family regulator